MSFLLFFLFSWHLLDQVIFSVHFIISICLLFITFFFLSSSEDTFFIAFREKERDIDLLPLMYTWTGDGNCNPGLCPDQELNPWPFSCRMMLYPTDPHWPVLFLFPFSSLSGLSKAMPFMRTFSEDGNVSNVCCLVQ